jgi:hypothetical protein
MLIIAISNKVLSNMGYLALETDIKAISNAAETIVLMIKAKN